METVRTFIAITLPADIAAALAEMIAIVQQSRDDVKWVDPQKVHLTLRFLGEVALNRLPAVFDAVAAACSQVPDFWLQTDAVGAFPAFKRPRVFWVGLEKDSARPLVVLQGALETALAAAGFPKENRRFRAHLTVGRVKQGQDAGEAAHRLRHYSFPKQDFPVNSVAVVKSVLTRSGPIYTVLKTCALPQRS